MLKLPKGVIDLRKTLKGYGGKWVILSKDKKKVVESATSFERLVKKAEGKWTGNVLMHPMKYYSRYIG
ncbi:MAG: hypothetical protein Q7S79_00080 [bacterium]|nr:hypothetical protein [bacterium]